MTTEFAAKLYEAQHTQQYYGRNYAVFNPNGVDESTLPIIYGFNNGGQPGWMSAVLLAEDGTSLGGHVCSSEAYMPADLGVLEGTRPDRHEGFRQHYPNGYRMEFVSGDEVNTHPGLNRAYELNQAKAAERREINGKEGR
jgi:hypothetical protein